MENALTIDGRQGEGGGQVLRSSLAFSALTGKPFSIHHIRGNRPKPGLRPQHLAAVRLAASLCGATVQGAEVGSHELSFEPGPLVGGRHHVDVGTAGSLTLLTQASLLPALACQEPVELILQGGTDVPMSPPLDYLENVVLPYYRRLGKVELTIRRRGFIPAGGGEIRLSIQGHGDAEPLHLTSWGDQERLVQGAVIAAEALRGADVAGRIATETERLLDFKPSQTYQQTKSPSVVATLWCCSGQVRAGATGLGRRRLPSEKLAKQMCRLWQQRLSHPHPVEEHLADQLIPLLALSGGTLKCQTISLHCRTNTEICGLFSGTRFEIEGSTVTAVR